MSLIICKGRILGLSWDKIPEMKNFIFLFLFFLAVTASAQQFELTPNGFEVIEIQRPNKTDEKLIEAAQDWSGVYNKQEHDEYNITSNSLDIDAMKDNAFFYRNVGETYTHRIKYTLKVNFTNESVRLQFVVKEIYSKKTLLKMTPSDFFLPDGRTKEDMEEAKQSLEKTANNVLMSFARFIQN